ncbi:hypothetical protein, unknown function [Leishmania donovani]|uniref:Phospholipid/glycerol acyltransferase domain-containing protein n=1 Tax=Leishmania donovani TaxID=5661 RepID=E9BL35_LEIDO|nr:hypothetical protein, unknown function [Leishmania donovani]CBZ35963.1 hypothetical protein, unknown function [Leishmania donovani]
MLPLLWTVFMPLYGCFLWLLHQRMLSVLLMRVWFSLHLAIAVIVTHIACRIISFFAYTLNIIPASTAQALSRFCKHVVFKVYFSANVPHVHTVQMPGSLPYSVMQRGAICSCHCSLFDPFFSMSVIPYSVLWNGRTFLKSSLLNLPLFGYALRCAAYFPVYFSDENSASFSVDKDKQAAVAADVENWVKKGKSLCFYPEGMVNRTPEVLKDFRLGSFKTILAHQMPLYYCVSYGNHEVWPPSLKGLPGYPADVYVYIGKYDYNPDEEDARSLATGLREEMQKHLDDMVLKGKRLKCEPRHVARHADQGGERGRRMIVEGHAGQL